LKSKDKEGWFPKWVQNAYKGAIWLVHGDYGAGRPKPTRDPRESNHERVLRQRAARAKQRADEKALNDLKEKA
jgi:hypothetical protein